MNLDSVRELKFALKETLPAIQATVMSRALPGDAVRAMSVREEAAPSVALGVARRGKNDFALAVRLQQRVDPQGKLIERLTKQAKGETDIRYIGEVFKRATPWYRDRQRPLRIGVSVGHFKITAGTLGAFVRPRGGGPVALLSNNHVLANENRAKKGDAILQPGSYDGGTNPEDAVATLTDFVRIKIPGTNTVDAAYATVAERIETDLTKLTGLGKLKGVGDVFLDEGTAVSKIGRTTGLTHGKVTAFELDNVTVGFDIGNARFDNQIEIESTGAGPFSLGGDSGSLIMGEDLRAVGLLFAGSDQGGSNGQGLTYANPIHGVLEALAIELAL